MADIIEIHVAKRHLALDVGHARVALELGEMVACRR